jgi:hypothetical protein
MFLPLVKQWPRDNRLIARYVCAHSGHEAWRWRGRGHLAWRGSLAAQIVFLNLRMDGK